jgi:hypothetical protein
MAHRTDKLNNYLVVCHLGERYPHHMSFCVLSEKAVEANLFKVTMTDDIRPASKNNSKGLQACMNIRLILKHKA